MAAAVTAMAASDVPVAPAIPPLLVLSLATVRALSHAALRGALALGPLAAPKTLSISAKGYMGRFLLPIIQPGLNII